MSFSLKPYEPSKKGRELIAVLFPLSHREKEKSFTTYLQQYPQETGAILDGFHYLVQEAIESGSEQETIDLSKEFLADVIARMNDTGTFFSYTSSIDFFNQIGKHRPPIFSDQKRVNDALNVSVKPEKKSGSTLNFPERYDESVEKKVTSICRKAERSYSAANRVLRSVRDSEKIIRRYQKDRTSVSIVDFALAKETFLESKTIFLKNSKIIAEGMEYIHGAYEAYRDNLVLMRIYIKYLAKLLVSRETKNPAENYVIGLAAGTFEFTAPQFEPTDKELDHGKTKVVLEREYRETLQISINRLESRYRKRKLTAKLKKGADIPAIIKELKEISTLDPHDIKTHIFLAKLLGEFSLSFDNHLKRRKFREQALHYCTLAFSNIEFYLDLQNIEKLKDRDIIRAGFVKTISTIRIPLIKNRLPEKS